MAMRKLNISVYTGFPTMPLPLPDGPLGLGGVYFLANQSTNASIFPETGLSQLQIQLIGTTGSIP